MIINNKSRWILSNENLWNNYHQLRLHTKGQTDLGKRKLHGDNNICTILVAWRKQENYQQFLNIFIVLLFLFWLIIRESHVYDRSPFPLPCITWQKMINSLALENLEVIFKVYFSTLFINKLISWTLSIELVRGEWLRSPWMISQHFFQVMACCCQSTSNYMSQCWPRPMLPFGVTRVQWIKWTELITFHKFLLKQSMLNLFSLYWRVPHLPLLSSRQASRSQCCFFLCGYITHMDGWGKWALCLRMWAGKDIYKQGKDGIDMLTHWGRNEMDTIFQMTF